VPLPGTTRIELPLLRVIEDAGGELKPKDAAQLIAKYFPEITPGDLSRTLSHGQNAWLNRVAWTRNELVTKGQVDKSARGIWKITEKGRVRLMLEWPNYISPTLTQLVPTKQEGAQEITSSSVTSDLHLVRTEDELYKPLKMWLDKTWGEQSRKEGNEFWSQITASQSRRGRWSRPDITSVEISRFELLPQKDVEISTFEVKRASDALNLASVYEAASHQRWGHYAYLVIEQPAHDPREVSYGFDSNYLNELRRFGVGLLGMYWNPAEGQYSIETLLDVLPARQHPDPRDVDKMLVDFFSYDPREARKFKDLVR
jgi:hypothetical protein